MRIDWNSETVVSAGIGRERVGGRPRPGKEVRRMLRVLGAMIAKGDPSGEPV